MLSVKYFDCSDFYRNLIKNLALARGLFNVKKHNLKDTFKKIDSGNKIIQNLNVNHPVLENDIFLKNIRKGMELNNDFKDFFTNFFTNLNYENLIKFEIKNYYILLFIEFETYLSNCIRSLLLKFPQILDKKSISREELSELENLDRDSIDEILIDKLIHEMSYGDLLDLFNNYKKILGIKHEIDRNLIVKLNGYREIRHLHIHKSGKIDSVFIQKVGKYGLDSKKIGINELTNGVKVEITMEMLEKAELLVLDVAYIFDKSYMKIFNK
ncbi:hypothetical protein LCGC14_0923420 [marine sediment metagenome]|uniref:Uncharacterized protein n=1 Tax=marine sediment metagenome TaxID=412755 RepID=A0A0F9NQ64_9ZZZZ